jgi:hypothetical protein
MYSRARFQDKNVEARSDEFIRGEVPDRSRDIYNKRKKQREKEKKEERKSAAIPARDNFAGFIALPRLHFPRSRRLVDRSLARSLDRTNEPKRAAGQAAS